MRVLINIVGADSTKVFQSCKPCIPGARCFAYYRRQSLRKNLPYKEQLCGFTVGTIIGFVLDKMNIAKSLKKSGNIDLEEAPVIEGEVILLHEVLKHVDSPDDIKS